MNNPHNKTPIILIMIVLV